MNLLKRALNFGKDGTAYNEAIKLFNEHDYREASVKFESVMQMETSTRGLYYTLSHFYSVQSHQNLGIILFVMGNYSEALQEFTTALEYNPDYYDIHYFIGVCKNNLGDYEGAMKSFRDLLSFDPSNMPARLKLGIVLHNHKMWDKAVSLYKNMLRRNPHFADIHYNLGLAYLGQGRPHEAIESFEHALKINQDYLQARVKIAIAHIYLGNVDNAFEVLIPLAEKYPEYPDIHYYSGLLYSVKNDLEKAVLSFKRALEINPSYKDAKAKLGALYCYFGKFDDGIKELEEASSLDPGYKNISITTKAVKDVLSSSSRSSETLKEMYIKALPAGKHIINTLPEFYKGVEISPDISEMITFIMNISEEDRSLYEMLIPYLKEHAAEHALYPDLHNSLGTLYLKINKPVEAEASFRKAVQLNPDYLKARINLFSVLKTLEKYDDAVREGEYILTGSVTYPDFHCDMAEIYDAMGDRDMALNSIFTSLAMNPDYSRAHFLAGTIYAKNGERNRAVEHYQKCLDSRPSKDLLDTAKDALEKLTLSSGSILAAFNDVQPGVHTIITHN